MQPQSLKNKPLVEAILEFKWEAAEENKSSPVDPNYRILLGRFFERVMKDYTVHEPLPSSTIPDEMVKNLPQHRFRTEAGEWPLVQLGPGLLSVNETEKYHWPEFRSRCEKAIANFVESYPSPTSLKPKSLALWYIDAVEFNHPKENIFHFMKEKMKTRLELPSALFKEARVQDKPASFKWQVSYGVERPKGRIKLRFGTGERNGRPSLIWETIVISNGNDVPKLSEDFMGWLDAAHDLADKWFFTLIEGDLHRQFSGE
ncbi:MAG: TIGR04255 family protein [Nitrospira sp.]|nr:MAG: TIGR04255 family protein [Nitrospira sp.]